MPASLRSYAEIAGALRSPYAADELVAPGEAPLLAVELTGAGPSPDEAETLRRLPLVTVAVVAPEPDAGTGARGGSGGTDRTSSGGGHPAVTPAVGAAGGSRAAEAFDVLLAAGDDRAGATVTAEAALDSIAAGAAANPTAAVAAVQLLRMSAALDVVDGLVAESFTYSTLQAGPEFGAWLTGAAARGPVRPPATGLPGAGGSPLLVERAGDELRITFDRPEVHNAFGFETRDALVEALQLAVNDTSIRSVVLTGNGPSFCSGGDLREFGTLADPASAHLVRTTRSAGYWLHRVADRLSVRVHGHCVGSGIELAAFGAHVAAAPDLAVALPEVGMGLVPGAGGTVSIPRRIGRHRTAYLCLTGERIGAATARAWGLVDEVG